MEGEELYDFPAVSGGDTKQVGPTLAEAKFGDVVMLGEPLFKDVGDDWKNGKWGPQIGTVTLGHTPTIVAGKVTVTATFVFDDGDMVAYQGQVPGNGSWKGKGRFGFVTGTGKFADRGGGIDVESTNPRHWG
jgi:hypothetical protein